MHRLDLGVPGPILEGWVLHEDRFPRGPSASLPGGAPFLTGPHSMHISAKLEPNPGGPPCWI